MTQPWYYAAGAHRHGPLTGDALVRLHQEGRIRADTPVWREGLDDWRPLSAMAAELGLGALPPPLPSGTTPHPPRRGLHGAWIAVIVLAIVAVVAVPLIAIMAAIAIPAYNDYTARSRIAQAIAPAEPLKHAVAQAVADGVCPALLEAPHAPALDPDDAIADALASLRASPGIASAEVAPDPGTGDCVIHIGLGDLGDAQVDGLRLDLVRSDAGRWDCYTKAPARLRPTQCRR